MAEFGHLRLVSENETGNPLQKEVLGVLNLIAEVYREDDWFRLFNICQEKTGNDKATLNYGEFVNRFRRQFGKFFEVLAPDSTLAGRIKQTNMLMMLVFLNYRNQLATNELVSKTSSNKLVWLHHYIRKITDLMRLDEAQTEKQRSAEVIEIPSLYRKMVNDILGN